MAGKLVAVLGKFFAAEQEHPDKVRQALEFIRTLYRHEEDSRAMRSRPR